MVTLRFLSVPASFQDEFQLDEFHPIFFLLSKLFIRRRRPLLVERCLVSNWHLDVWILHHWKTQSLLNSCMIHVNIRICPRFKGWRAYVTCDVTQKRGIFFLLMSHNLGDAKETMDWKSWPRNDRLRWEEFSYKCHFVVGQVYIIGVIHLLFGWMHTSHF